MLSPVLFSMLLLPLSLSFGRRWMWASSLVPTLALALAWGLPSSQHVAGTKGSAERAARREARVQRLQRRWPHRSGRGGVGRRCGIGRWQREQGVVNAARDGVVRP